MELNSPAVTGLNAIPVVASMSGEGAAANLKIIEAIVTPTAALSPLGTVGTAFRLLRLPVSAKVKSVLVASTGQFDQGAMSLDLDIAYSNSTVDGTSVVDQGGIPTTSGGLTYSGAGYFTSGSPNVLFGTISGFASAISPKEMVFSGSNYSMLLAANTPLWVLLGLGVSQPGGSPVAPGGMLDLMAVVSTAASRPVYGASLWCRVEFAL